MMKKIFVLFFLIVSVSFAASFDISVFRESISVPAGSANYFEFNITSEKDDVLAITVDGRPWMSMSNRLSLEADKVKHAMLYAKPDADVTPGNYKAVVIFKSLSNDLSIEKTLYVSVTHEKKVSFEKVTVSGSLEPSGKIEVKTYLKNYEDVTVNNVVIKGTIDSPTGKLADINDVVTEMNPGQSAEVRKIVDMPSQAQPGMYRVNIEMSYNNRTEKFTQPFSVGSKEVFDKTVADFIAFVGYGREISVVNKGNLPGSITIHDEVGMFYFGPAPSKIEGKTYYWELSNVQPGEQRTIRYEINYLPLILLLIFLAVLCWTLLFKIRTLRIRKFIMQKKHINEGTEFTVGLDIRNCSGTKLKDVVIKDFVPPVFVVKDAPGYKSIKKKGHSGTHLIWKFDEFGRNEERILSYKIVPLISVTGEVRLPRAHVQFKNNMGPMKNSSLTTTIGINPPRKMRED